MKCILRYKASSYEEDENKLEALARDGYRLSSFGTILIAFLVITLVVTALTGCNNDKTVELIKGANWKNLTKNQRNKQAVELCVDKLNLSESSIVIGCNSTIIDNNDKSIEAPISEGIEIVDDNKLVKLQSVLDQNNLYGYNAFVEEDKEYEKWTSEEYSYLNEYINAVDEIDYSLLEWDNITRYYDGFLTYEDIEKEREEEQYNYYVIDDGTVISKNEITDTGLHFLGFQFVNNESEKPQVIFMYICLER